MTRKQHVLLFLYSRKNIIGASLGLIGLLLLFTGVIRDFWYLIVPGLYLIGVLATPRSERVSLQLRNEVTAEEIRDALNRLERSVRRKVPKEILEYVKSIKLSVEEILPYIVNINSADHDIFTIRQVTLEFLPTALENYLNLPPAYANYHPVQDGKTARHLLEEQLELLDQEMKKVVIDLQQNNTQQLLVHGRFLREKYKQAETWLR